MQYRSGSALPRALEFRGGKTIFRVSVRGPYLIRGVERISAASGEHALSIPAKEWSRQAMLHHLVAVLGMGDRHSRQRREDKRRWMAKLRKGAVIEPGELDLVECEQPKVVRRLAMNSS